MQEGIARRRLEVSKSQIEKISNDVFEAFDAVVGDNFDFTRHQKYLSDFIDLSVFHFSLLFKEDDREIIRDLCKDAANNQRTITMSFRHHDFHYPWGLLIFDEHKRTISDFENLDELSKSMIGTYAVSARFPHDYGVPHTLGPATISEGLPSIVFAGGPMKYVQKVERPFFKLLNRQNCINLRDFVASDFQPDMLERSLFAPTGTSSDDIYHLACHSDHKKAAQRLQLGDGKEVSSIRMKNQDINFQGKELVFLNACETAIYRVSDYNDFVRTCLKGKTGATTLVGTDCTVGDKMSAKFALQVYLYFIVDNQDIGTAILNARKKLINRGSLIGYAYSIFGNPFLKRSEQT